jgi:hypothetical protein
VAGMDGGTLGGVEDILLLLENRKDDSLNTT